MKQQNFGRAILFMLTAVAVALGVYMLVSDRRTSQRPEVVAPPEITGSTGGVEHTLKEDNKPVSDVKGKLTVPLSQEQSAIQELERRRGPLYNTIRQSFSSLLSGFQPDKDDRAILCLYLNRKSSADVDTLMAQLVKPSVADYAFTHIRFYVQEDAEGVTKWAVDSEADCGSDSIWKLIRK